MKRTVIAALLLGNVLAGAFSQTNGSWTVTNTGTWIGAVNGIRSGGNNKAYTITVTGTVSVPPSAESTFGPGTGISVSLEGSGTLALSGSGRLLFIGKDQTVIAKDLTLRGRADNTASVVRIEQGGAFRMEGSASVSGNTAKGEDGGVSNSGTFTMEGGAISGNTGVHGGVSNGGTFTMKGGTISGNTASFGGGGVSNSGTFTMEGGAISDNTADGGGGGVYNFGTFTMKEGTISGNTASRGGGGVYIGGSGTYKKGGTFTMEGGTISDNTAKGDGGGVSNNNYGTFTMKEGAISGNTASGSGGGGGVYNFGTFTIKEGTISGNTARGGGGVYIGGSGTYGKGGTFTMEGGTISGNTTSNNGGGVYVYGGGDSYSGFSSGWDVGTFIMEGGVISGNTASNNGGGVYISSGTFTMKDGAISGNTAYSGGGVYGGFTKTGGTIYGNDAEPRLRNTAGSRKGYAMYGKDGNWRNSTADSGMNPDSYGFWLNEEEEVVNSMVRISGGTFMMGSPPSEVRRGNWEGPQHQVRVSSFYIGKYEVTQKEYQELMGTNPSYFKGDNLPVECVSWYDAVNYCNALSRKEGLTPAYTVNGTSVTWNRNANGYRLPTEAEWEYACRAGTTSPFSTGNNITTSQANYNGNFPYNNNPKGEYRGKTIPVGSFPANPWGLYDMHGNVSEWCWDWFGDYTSGSQTDPAGSSSGSRRVIRGGGWNYYGQNLRSADRNNFGPSDGDDYVGFRVLRP